jgi:hypothetical protein
MNESTKISKSKSTSFEFFPSDWMTDTGLRMCSLEARGLWIDIICLMQLSEKKGFLLIGNQKINEEKLRKMFGISKKKIQLLMTELLDYNLIKVSEDGTYFCKRIVENEHIRHVRSVAGQIGVKQKMQVSQSSLLKQNSKQNSEDGENLLETDEKKPIYIYNNIDNIKNIDIGYNTKIPLFEDKERKDEKKEKPTQIVITHPLQVYIRDKFPQVSKLKKQMSAEDCEKLLSKFTNEQIANTLKQMENFKQLPAKYMSVYLTINNWLNRQSNESTSNNNKPNNRGADFENALRNF